MAANIPVQQQQQGNMGTPTPVPVTLVTTMPMGVPPLAQLTPSAVSVPTTVQTIPMQVQNTLATNSMQVPSVVPSSTPSMAQSTVVTSTPPAKVASHTVSTVVSNANTATQQSSANENTLVSRSRLQDLVREVDATETLDDEVEDLLLQLADDFVESTVNAACLLAKHRKATTVEVRDVQLHLERNWNMWTPGFGTDELRPYKRAPVTEAHKQRLALIRKAIKKY